MYYTLNEKKEVIAHEGLKDGWERIAEDIVDSKRISTVFLSMECFGDKQLFETMIFDEDGGEALDYQERCSTYDEALKQHADAINHIRRKINEV